MGEVAGTAIVSVLPMVELNELMETGGVSRNFR